MKSLSSTLILLWFLWIFHLSLLSSIFFLPTMVQQSPFLPGEIGPVSPDDHQYCFPVGEIDYVRKTEAASFSQVRAKMHV